LDEAFKINVAKMRVQLPAKIREDVKAAIIPVTRLARETYDRKERREGHSGTSSNPAPSSKGATSMPIIRVDGNAKTNQQYEPFASAQKNNDLMSEDQWAERMLAVATKQERPIVKAVLARLRSR
jgi:hypothetical protein